MRSPRGWQTSLRPARCCAAATVLWAHKNHKRFTMWISAVRKGQPALLLLLTFENSLLIYVLCVCLCVCPFQLAAETAVLYSQSVPGLWGRSVWVPLWCGDVWELQSLL